MSSPSPSGRRTWGRRRWWWGRPPAPRWWPVRSRPCRRSPRRSRRGRGRAPPARAPSVDPSAAEYRWGVLYAFGFERVAVLVGDLYFVNPRPLEGQEGAERGVRLELRMLERQPLRGGIYSAQPIGVERPLWRVDLLEAVGSSPGSLDRAHPPPAFAGWDPGPRHFDPELSAAPVEWLAAQLADPGAVLERAGVAAGEVSAGDIAALREA